MKKFIPIAAICLVALLAIVGGRMAPVGAQDDPTAMNKPVVVAGDNPGEVVVTWQANDQANFYRIAGWPAKITMRSGQPAVIGVKR